MGRSKLLLPWGEATIIDRVLQAWTSSRVSHVAVIVRRNDLDLRRACDRWPVSIITPNSDPREMKESVQIGLRHLAEHADPGADDGCFIAPADLPTLTAEIIDRLIAGAIEADSQASGKIVVPRFGDRPGHPALLPWSLTSEIFELGENEGVNQIVGRHEKQFVPFSAEKLVVDVNTPEQYQQLLRKTGTN